MDGINADVLKSTTQGSALSLHSSKPIDPLSGAWRVVETIARSEVRVEDSPAFLWFVDGVMISGDKHAAWEAPYRLDLNPNPQRIDILRNDLNTPWTQRGIFRISDGNLALCVSSRVDFPRPAFFEKNNVKHIRYSAVACEEPMPD